MLCSERLCITAVILMKTSEGPGRVVYVTHVKGTVQVTGRQVYLDQRLPAPDRWAGAAAE